MLLELTEVLACPRCGPPQGLVAFVSDSCERRILRGELGCPGCDARFPLHHGVLDMRGEEGSSESGGVNAAGGAVRQDCEGAGEPGGDAASGLEGPDLALRVAALLGQEGGGTVLLEEGLCDVAGQVARLLPGTEVIALQATAETSPDASTCAETDSAAALHSRVVVRPGAPRPLLDGRMRGVALVGGPGSRLREAARVLRPAGRVVVFLPAAEVAAQLAMLGFEVLAADRHCLLAGRTQGC